ncbi:hypothetical protein GUJ93_ZPchr0012g19927 [Zizania palustris]|uniref:Uncharacterized protein n=1 Tax=Zizania palustris TaxID=103762 RepID=A0A8J6BTK7_ZIZPA|nr:hypothetical protein GUJ93_ZPchr0012g19927 [Zizania palustris]
MKAPDGEGSGDGVSTHELGQEASLPAGQRLRVEADHLPEDAYSTAANWPSTLLRPLSVDSYGASIQVNKGDLYMTSAGTPTCLYLIWLPVYLQAPLLIIRYTYLWDATSGELRCTYRAYDAMDEITAALSVSFNSTGAKYVHFT